jgi:hypothetical protein
MADNLAWLDNLIANDKPAVKDTNIAGANEATPAIAQPDVAKPATTKLMEAAPKSNDSQLGWLDNLIANDTKVQQTPATTNTAPTTKQPEVNLDGMTEAPPPPGGYKDPNAPQPKKEKTFFESARDFVANASDVFAYPVKKFSNDPVKFISDGVAGVADVAMDLPATAKYVANIYQANVGMPTAAIVNNLLSKTGLVDDHSKEIKEDIKTIQANIKKYDERHDTLGKYGNADAVENILLTSIPLMRSYKSAIALEATLGAMMGVKENALDPNHKGPITDSMYVDAAVGGAVGAMGTFAINRLAAKLGENAIPKGMDKDVFNWMLSKKLSPEQAADILKDVPKNEQAYRAAMALGDTGKGVMKQAVYSDNLSNKLNILARERANDIAKVGNTLNADEHLAVAGENFKKISELINTYDLPMDMTETFKGIKNIRDVNGITASPAINELNAIRNQWTTNGKDVQLADVLEVRKKVNALIRDADGADKSTLNEVKTAIDKTIEGSSKVPDTVKNALNKANLDYATAVKNKELAEIVNKNIDSHGLMDYKKYMKDLEESGIKTEQAKATAKLAEEYAEKYKNDKMFIGSKGSDRWRSVMGLLGLASTYAQQAVIRWGEYGLNNKVQAKVTKYLKNSKTMYEALSKITTDYKIPEEIRTKFEAEMHKIDKSELGPIEKGIARQGLAKAKAEGENLSRELERIKLQVNKANTEVLSKELALERAQQRNITGKALELLEQKLENSKDAHAILYKDLLRIEDRIGKNVDTQANYRKLSE